MSNIRIEILIPIIYALSGFTAFAQNSQLFLSSDENIKKKPFIIPETPVKKQKITPDYHFFSIPYDYSFKPTTEGYPIRLKNKPKEPAKYSTFLSLGYGSYGTILSEGYTKYDFDKNHNLDIYFKHHSSQKGIPRNPLDHYFYRTSISATDRYSHKNFDLETCLSFRHKIVNRYGLPEIYISKAPEINPKRILYATDWSVIISPIKHKIQKIEATFDGIFDALGHGESNAVINTKSKLIINQEQVWMDINADFVSSGFWNAESRYNSLIFNASPYINLQKEDLTLKVGAYIYYYGKTTADENEILSIYPIVDTSYRFVHDYMTLYGGVEGKSIQNTYDKYSKVNPFLGPSINMAVTNQRLKLFFGIKGEVFSNIDYDFKGCMMFVDNQPLYKLFVPNLNDNFGYGNAFDIVYDKMDVFESTVNLSWTDQKHMDISLNATFGTYNTHVEKRAWNMPNIKGSILFEYDFANRLQLDSDVFFVGTRFDSLSGKVLRLESFLDANVKAWYNFRENITFFASLNNILSQNYQRWAHFKSQGVQLLIGGRYEF